MSENLVIVESPTKAKTLKKYLGDKYTVKASMGHVIDLPASKFGVDVDKDFEPHYIIIRGKGKILKEIRSAAKKAKRIYLASDPDREGEAIAWHLAGQVRDGGTHPHADSSGGSDTGSPKTRKPDSAGGRRKSEQGERKHVYRVILHEITAKKVKEAIAHPEELDVKKFNAQQARRILDRVVGYKLSPLLWKKVKRGLSAGRVQSVAVRLVVDREKEIRKFVPIEYGSLTAEFRAGSPPPFKARLRELDGVRIAHGKPEPGERIMTQAEMAPLKEQLSAHASFTVGETETKELRRHPSPPFITSELQREAARRYHYPARKTMMIAQQLYEGIAIGDEGPTGLITYMRTDSVRISADAVNDARAFIRARFDRSFLPAEARSYRNKKSAQDAHEAIRPSDVSRTPDALRSFLTDEQFKVYQIVWQRFVASQMADAILDQTRVDIEAELPRGPANGGGHRAVFRANGSTVKFEGFTVLYREGKDEEAPDSEEDPRLPTVKVGETLDLLGLEDRQHFTQPPPRYSESSLIKELEEKGIGRPSTYAVIISTIQLRGYVYKDKGRFKPSALGELITELLIESFPEVLDLQFTAEMEEKLDKIEEGEADWVETLREFYGPFSRALDRAAVEMRTVRGVVEEVGRNCPDPKCGKPLVIRFGVRGRFVACTGFPDCRHTESLPVEPAEGENKQEGALTEEKGGNDGLDISG
ncbi:MAG: type I DNA topoisomerase [Nitrospirae bacterium]|nr:type I DNA topoisomerase [Nitrospirota bacterium]